METAGYPTIPYVNSGGNPPDGYDQFLETPRYSTGYAGLFQTMGYMTETHMLKLYPQRVTATRAFFDASLKLLAQEGKSIQSLRQKDRDTYRRQQSAPIAWEVDRNHPARLEFHGYEASQVPSTVTGGTRLFYDREKPFVRNIPYFNQYKVSQSVTLPAGYLIPRMAHGDRFNGKEFHRHAGCEHTRDRSGGDISHRQFSIEDDSLRRTLFS